MTVTAAILKHSDNILVAQRKACLRLSGMWEFLGGKLERGETSEDCLKRELREEFGIEVSVGHFVAKSIHHYDHITIRLIANAATLLGGRLKPTDHDDFRWVTICELDRYEFAQDDVPFVRMLRGADVQNFYVSVKMLLDKMDSAKSRKLNMLKRLKLLKER